MTEIIESFPSEDALQTWRNAHRIMNKYNKCIGYTGYLVNTQAGAPKGEKKKLHTAQCDHTGRHVVHTHWLASEDREALIARADTLHPSHDGYTWQDCPDCVAEAGSME